MTDPLFERIMKEPKAMVSMLLYDEVYCCCHYEPGNDTGEPDTIEVL